MSEPEAQAQWLETELDRILGAAAPEEVGRTLPVVFLALARVYGATNLAPEVQEELQKIAEAAGCSNDQSPTEIGARLTRYAEFLNPSENLLFQLEQAYQRHYAAIARQHGRDFHRVVERRQDLRAPELGAPAPVGSVRSRDLTLHRTGRLSLR